MNLEIQKASLLKRFSAFLLDFILMTIAITGFAFLISIITNYDSHYDAVQNKIEEYNSSLSELGENVNIFMSEEEFNKLSPEAQDKFKSIFEAFSTDEKLNYSYTMLFYLTLVIMTFGTLLGFVLLEFVIPLILKNGQTVGKKIFGIGVMHINGIRVSSIAVFIRAVLGKCTVEFMVPMVILFTMLFGGGGIVGLIVLMLILCLEIFVFFKNRMNTPIHDVISQTVTIDLASQMVFDSEEDMLAYRMRLHEITVRDTKS